MSDPIDTTKVAKYGAIPNALCELVSAESSCHMFPDPVPAPSVPCDCCGGSRRTADGMGPCERCQPERERYISESDANVAHALEHMHAAFRLMNMAHYDQESLKGQVYRLVVQLREAGIEPRVKTWLDEPVEGLEGLDIEGAEQ